MAIKRTPTILQLEAAECGAASLAIILGYYRKFLPLDELRSLCGVSRDGAKASNILKAARKLGLEAQGLKAELDHLETFDEPAIAFVNFNHYVVIEGVKNGKVYINDPASGHRKEPIEEFSDRFTGVVLTFKKGQAFQKGDERPGVAQSLYARLDGFKISLLYVTLVSLLLLIPGLIIPFFSQIFVDYVLVRSIDGWLWPVLIGMTIATALNIGLKVLQEFTLLNLGSEIKRKTGHQLLQHMLRLPIVFFEQRFTGEISDRVGLNEKLVTLLSDDVIEAVINLVLALFYLAVMFYFSFWLSAIILSISVLNMGVIALLGRMVSENYRKMSIESGKLMGSRISGLKDIETYKASGGEGLLYARWTGMHAGIINAEQEIAKVTTYTDKLPGLIAGFIFLLTLLGGAYLVIQGQFSLGQFVAYQALATGFVGPVAALAGFGGELLQVRTYLGQLDDTLDQDVDATFTQSDGPLSEGLPRGAVQLVNGTFGYNTLDRPLIDNLSISIRSGERIALIGPSGSGKSTVGKIIGGLVQLQSGEVLISGRTAREWPRDILASRLAYVRQDVTLFQGTIRDNITLWDPTISQDDIEQSAKDACLHDLILSRPGGYDAIVAEGASNFSGGEKQRMELARALATRPSIIILDEATSALDPLTELSVMEAIRRRGITSIVIAHRLSAIRDCDEILVLKNGQLVQRGTHSRLSDEPDGVYARLLET